jgi:hypothetical protein
MALGETCVMRDHGPEEDEAMISWVKTHIPALVGWTVALVMTAFALGAWATSLSAKVEANTAGRQENARVVGVLRDSVRGLERVTTKLETIVDRME